MLALIGNFDLAELGVILLVAILVFGRRLPEVAMRAAAHVARLRRQLLKMWREAGLEEELRRVRDEVERDMPDASLKIDPIGDLRRTVEAPLRSPPPRAADMRRAAEERKREVDEMRGLQDELAPTIDEGAPEPEVDLDATVALPRSKPGAAEPEPTVRLEREPKSGGDAGAAPDLGAADKGAADKGADA